MRGGKKGAVRRRGGGVGEEKGRRGQVP